MYKNLDFEKGLVLAVDDDASQLLIIESALSDYYDVVTTVSPKKALTLAKQYSPDVILLDIDMPDMDGFELCSQLQNMPELANASFMFITSHNKMEIEAKALSLGAVDFISKPIHLDICRLRVKSQMTIRQQAKSVHKAYTRLHSKKKHLDTILDSMGDAVIVTDTQEVVTYINPIAERLTGWSKTDALGEKLQTVMVLQDASTQHNMINPLTVALGQKRTVAMALNAEIVSRDGTHYRVEDTASPILDMEGHHLIGGVIVFQDVSNAVEMSTKMTHLTNHDQLTGLPNRILLHDRMLQAIKTATFSNKMVAAFLLDLDHFKYLNDAVGHHHGDLIIKHVARSLESIGDYNTTISRIGGDEFVILAGECESIAVINSIAESIQTAINTPFDIGDDQHRLSASIGVSVFPADAHSPEELMRHADTAMYKVKNEGRSGFALYAEELLRDVKARVDIEKLLRQRLEENALMVYFQPKYYLANGELSGVEALVRMEGVDGKLLPPDQFIPIAEDSGLIVDIGKEVLRKSCVQGRRWLDDGYAVKVAVNIGASQFNAFGFSQLVVDILRDTGLPANYLELEITESALLQNISTAQKAIWSLQSVGVTVALDDFGTGYSSLSYLRSFNFDVLKIDRSFIMDIDRDNQALRIVKAIIDLANTLSLTVVCEGIETNAQLEALKVMGCEQGQGYYFCKPIPADLLKLN